MPGEQCQHVLKAPREEEERAEGKCCLDRDWGTGETRESAVINSETSSKGLTSWGSEASLPDRMPMRFQNHSLNRLRAWNISTFQTIIKSERKNWEGEPIQPCLGGK